MNEQDNGTSREPEDETITAGTEEDGAPVRDEASAAADDGGGSDAEAAAMRDRYLRLAAEFENYKRRVERERGENAVRAQVHLLERLLEPLDDLLRISEQDADTTTVAALRDGAGMVQKKFVRVLEAAGVEEIEAEGRPFDPTIHEALTTVPAESPDEDDIVAQVYQRGYLMKGALVRPARVVVRKFAG